MRSLEFLSRLPFDGLALGGSFGRDRAELLAMLADVTPRMPTSKPRHLLGIADMPSIEAAVPFGLDTFDSCYPTRLSRHGTALTVAGAKLDLRKSKYRLDFTRPLDPDCDCATCRTHSVGYLRHLVKARESAAGLLLTQHNIRAMALFMERMRGLILADEL